GRAPLQGSQGPAHAGPLLADAGPRPAAVHAERRGRRAALDSGGRSRDTAQLRRRPAPARGPGSTAVSIYLVRHVKAGFRSRWEDDDRLRPVSKAGQVQALRMVDVLDRMHFERIVSSPYVRCIESMAPLASVRGL